MIQIDDKVIYSGDPRKLKGKVVDIVQTLYWPNLEVAVVQFDDPELFPRRMEIEFMHLTKIEAIPEVNSNCCCGLKFIKDGGKHSDYCEVKNV